MFVGIGTIVFALLFVVIMGVIQADSSASLSPQADSSVPPQTIIHEEIYTVDWQSVMPIIFAIAGIIAVAVLIVWAVRFFKIGNKLEDLRDDKNKTGAYAFNLPGAGGICRLKLSVVEALLSANPTHFCILHDNRRKVVQRILFNPNKDFPYKMIFDYNRNYGAGEYNFSGCSYITLARSERKKLAKHLRRSRFDSDGVTFAVNELKTCAKMTEITDEMVINAKAECAEAMQEQGIILERLMTTEG